MDAKAMVARAKEFRWWASKYPAESFQHKWYIEEAEKLEKEASSHQQ